MFPTPFRGVYYYPVETEQDAYYITYPYKVLIEAAKRVLGADVYYGLVTAMYFERKVWNPVPAHIMNTKRSGRLSLAAKEHRYWRSEKRYSIIRQFPYPISLHRIRKTLRERLAYKDGIAFAPSKVNQKDAGYLCQRGSKDACDFLLTYHTGRPKKPRR